MQTELKMNDFNNLICREIKIDVTNVCNLSCPLCPDTDRRTGREHAPKIMSFSEFKKFADSIKIFPEHITFGSKHEPLINKSIWKMIKYINDKNADLQTSILTNLNLLGSVSEMVESKVRNVLIGLDGIDQESYEKYRTGGNFDVVIDNIKLIQHYKKKINSEYPKLSVIFVVFRHNEHLTDLAKEFFKKFEVDVCFRRTDFYKGFEDWMPVNFQCLHEKTACGHCCNEPFESANINVFGDVYPCCAEEIIKFPVGNVFQQPFDEIWNGEKINNIRNFLLNKTAGNSGAACLFCPVYKRNGCTDV